MVDQFVEPRSADVERLVGRDDIRRLPLEMVGSGRAFANPLLDGRIGNKPRRIHGWLNRPGVSHPADPLWPRPRHAFVTGRRFGDAKSASCASRSATWPADRFSFGDGPLLIGIGGAFATLISDLRCLHEAGGSAMRPEQLAGDSSNAG